MRALHAIREWWAGRYESEPFYLPTNEEVWWFLRACPRCTQCFREIDPYSQPLVVVQKDGSGMSAHHQDCAVVAAAVSGEAEKMNAEE